MNYKNTNFTNLAAHYYRYYVFLLRIVGNSKNMRVVRNVLLVGLGIEYVLYRNINAHFKSVLNFFIELKGGLCSTTDIFT